MSKIPTGARLNEDQPLLDDLVKKVEKALDSRFVFGRLKWAKDFGRPDVADMRHAFEPKVYVPIDVLGKTVYGRVHQVMGMSHPVERDGEYLIDLRCLLPDSPEEARSDFTYKAVVEIDGVYTMG